MNLPQRLSRKLGPAHRVWLCAVLVTAVCGLACCGAAWGQEDMEGETSSSAEAAESPPYVLPYALVIACVGLGVMLVCRSANRHALTQKWKPVGLSGARGDAESDDTAGPAPRTKQVSKEAQTALGISIAGVIPVVGLFVGAFGLFKSVQAKKAIDQNRLLAGEGIALSGIIVGAIMIVVQLVVTIVIVIKMAS